jgi:membrane peptidoglycan carboxypeptidase
VEIERNFEKDEILRMYLNEIPYGSNAYGIESAAQTFFGVHAKDLTIAQSALLASLPQRPSYFSPDGKNTDELLHRWKKTLNNMAKFGYISQEELGAAKKEDILGQIKPLKIDIKAPHFSLYVRDKLIEEFGEEDVKKGGYRVYTTLDWNLQQLGEKTVREGVGEHGEKWEFENAALVATNPKNGQVLAMVGSRDYFADDIDGNVNVAIRMRQPGSSFKPYVYAQAFSEGYRPETQVFDVLTNFTDEEDKKYMPKNYDGRYIGAVKLEEALARSLNVPAVKALYLTGINDSIRLAKSMGITTLNNPQRYGLSLVLGGGEVKLLDHVGAFGVFANEGVKYNQQVILKIEDSEGNVVKEYNNDQGIQVLDRNIANQIVKILSDNKLRTPAFGPNSNLNIPDRTVAAKTGTTNEYRDGWLVGASPSLAAGVWAGNNDNRAMKPGAAGANVAGPIWNTFMTEALANYPNEKFSDVEEDEERIEAIRGKKSKDVLFGELRLVEEIEVCETDDDEFCLETSDCPDDEVEDEKFFVAHNILHYIDREDPLGDRPRRPQEDPQYDNWEEAVINWAEKYADGKGRDPAPTEECDEDDF